MADSIKEILWGNFDFSGIKDNHEFKEDSVREVIILPLLKYLGYGEDNIVRSLTLQHPFLKIGSNKKYPIHLVPDYVLRIENRYAWVLDAKGPRENLLDEDYVGQVYSYAVHPEIRSNYIALCNGIEFSLYRTDGNNEPILFFQLDEIDFYFDKLKNLLSSNSFQIGKQVVYESTKKSDFDYLKQRLPGEVRAHKQTAKRHFGVHGYFTKQSWDIVQTYIKNFTLPGDVVLDPFGGSGVTAIEALMTNRQGINVDINPMAIFMVDALTTYVNQQELISAFNEIKTKYLKNEPKTDEEIKEAIQNYPQPKPIKLAKGSDVSTADLLFSDKQKAQLGLLKYLILKQKNESIRKTLMLMFSGLLTKINLTYHQSSDRSEGRGNASAFAYYRYRIAPHPVELEVMKYYEIRLKKILEAKKELRYYINEQTSDHLKIVKGSATDLHFIPSESIGEYRLYLYRPAIWCQDTVSRSFCNVECVGGFGSKHNGATLEQINDELIVKGLELGFLDLLKKEYTDLTPILVNNFDYDEETATYCIKKNTKFTTHIDVRLRIKYYLISYLRRKERENKPVTFDDIILEVIPLLKNGTTPENQTVLSVLEDIGQRSGDNYWTLKKTGTQLDLFGAV